MRRLTALLISTSLVVVPLTSVSTPAGAQIKVYDGLNHVENILSALRAFIQIANQLQMLTQLKDGMDWEQAGMLLTAALSAIGPLIALTDTFANEQTYDGTFGETSPGFTPESNEASWAQSRDIGHKNAVGTFKLLAKQLPTILGQAQQIRRSIEIGRAQGGIVGAVQATVEVVGVAGQMLNTLEVFQAQQLRLQAASASRELQKEERALAAHRIQTAPLQGSLPPSRLRGLFE